MVRVKVRGSRLLPVDVALLHGAAIVLPVNGLHGAGGQVEAHLVMVRARARARARAGVRVRVRVEVRESSG